MKKNSVLVFIALCLFVGVACGQSPDKVLFDFRAKDTQDGWHLNIYGENAKGVKRGGSGKTQLVAGRHAGEKALRFSSKDAGAYNFIPPEIHDGIWRKHNYYGIEIRYRGDGSAGQMRLAAVTSEGHYSISLRFDGTRTWKCETYRSGWSRSGTPPINWSKLQHLYVNGSGTRAIDIETITLVGGVKQMHLAPCHAADQISDLDVGPHSDAKIEVLQIELLKLDKSGVGYNCRFVLQHGNVKDGRVFAELRLTPPGGDTATVAKQQIVLDRGAERYVSLPFEYKQTRDGTHLLNVVIRDSKGRVAATSQFAFSSMLPRELDYEKVVLWPEPQVWRPGIHRWTLPEAISLRTTGTGDAFPAEHLAEKLNSRYGVRVTKPKGRPADVRLDFVTRGIEPEGFVLDVDASGVHLQASTSRGMYYAVRALLDIVRQSSFAKPKAGILYTHCEDWPDIPVRVYTDFFISERYHKTPMTVEAFQKHIYDQIAGGRYNLYLMQIDEHVRYDSHPELAPSHNCFTKAQLKQIIDFSRKHYVDIAPGWNTPGHCGWLVQHVHKELREDGENRTLCTSNPEGMRMLKDIAEELLELFKPKYFLMAGDEVNQGWNRIAKRTCKLCAGKARNQLLLEHWTELARFFQQRGVKPILFDDMLSVTWNGGAPYHCAEILPKLPRNLIIATWSIPPLSVPPRRLRSLGFIPWSTQTAFEARKMDAVPAVWKDYDAFGILETTTWVWSNFTHSEKQCSYSTPALHANAACCWKPAVATVGQVELVYSDGVHWSNVMEVPDWGTRRLVYQPISIAAACNDSTRDAIAGDGKGWMDLGPEHDLSSLPGGLMSIGGVPFDRPKFANDCILMKHQQASRPVQVGRHVRGFAFAHTAGADTAQTKALRQRFFRKNTDSLALPVAYYRVRYETGDSTMIPVRLGYDIHLWDCEPRARVMPGPSTYWMGLTVARQHREPPEPDACVWVMEWTNPHPELSVKSVTFMAADTEATVVCLGVSAVE